jgi:hypothetical protein
VHVRSNQYLIYVYLISSSKDSLAFDIYVQRLLCFNAQMGGCFHHTGSLYPKIQRTKEHSVFCIELKRPHSLLMFLFGLCAEISPPLTACEHQPHGIKFKLSDNMPVCLYKTLRYTAHGLSLRLWNQQNVGFIRYAVFVCLKTRSFTVHVSVVCHINN